MVDLDALCVQVIIYTSRVDGNRRVTTKDVITNKCKGRVVGEGISVRR